MDSDSEDYGETGERRSLDNVAFSMSRRRVGARAPDQRRTVINEALYGGQRESQIRKTGQVEHETDDLSGTRIPLGYARFRESTLDVNDYKFFVIGGWRVAINRNNNDRKTHELLKTIFREGPRPAGYVVVGDTMVPWELTVGERHTLATGASV
jgi:hypothetical protein